MKTVFNWLLPALVGIASLEVALGAQAPRTAILPSISAGVHSPTRVAVAPDGRILVSETALGRVNIFDGSGRLIESRSGLGSPLAVAVDHAGRVLVSDQARGSVSVYDADWNLVSTLGRGEREFGLPGAIAVSSPGGAQAVYVCDSTANQVKVYSGENVSFVFGAYGTNNGQFDFPCALYLSGQELFVLDQNNDRVQVFDLAGNYLRQFTLATYPTGGMFAPRRAGRALGLTGDVAGRIYVSDGFQGHIKIFDMQGTFLGALRGSPSAPFRTPTGLVVDAQNRLLVTLANSASVAVVGLDNYLSVNLVPPSQVVAAGASATFTAAVGGPGPFSFQWRKGAEDLSDSGNVSGSTGSVLNLTSATPADSGHYSVSITGPSGTLFSHGSALTVLNPPLIISQPTNLVARLNETATFVAAASGDALRYQWVFNGNEIYGATSSSLSLPVKTSQAGRYQLRISNPIGAVTSSQATLDVIIPPAQPVLQPLSFSDEAEPRLIIFVHPNQTYAIEKSTNLLDWTYLTSVFNETGTIELTDFVGRGLARQFYRVRWLEK